jgi:hypothetical protein
MILLIAQWGVYRIPLDFRLVKPKTGKGYRSENTLVRDMLEALVLPPGCEKVIVVADAAYASRENLKAIQARGGSLSSPSPAPGSSTMANICVISSPICPFTITVKSGGSL